MVFSGCFEDVFASFWIVLVVLGVFFCVFGYFWVFFFGVLGISGCAMVFLVFWGDV